MLETREARIKMQKNIAKKYRNEQKEYIKELSKLTPKQLRRHIQDEIDAKQQLQQQETAKARFCKILL